jgi:hypothetical protein
VQARLGIKFLFPIRKWDHGDSSSGVCNDESYWITLPLPVPVPIPTLWVGPRGCIL